MRRTTDEMTKARKEAMRLLGLKKPPTYREIAERVGVHFRTIARWAQK